MVILWAAWATSTIYELKGFAQLGPRFTQVDATNLELRIKEWSRANFSSSLELKQEIAEINNQVTMTHKEIEEIRLMLARSGIGEK